MRQRLLIVALLAIAAVLVVVLVLVPRLTRAPVLSGYVEGESLYLASPVSGSVTVRLRLIVAMSMPFHRQVGQSRLLRHR